MKTTFDINGSLLAAGKAQAARQQTTLGAAD
jgi:hypothetical protein